MLSKNQIKKLRALQRKKVRNSKGLYVVEGKKLVHEILISDESWLELYALESWFKEHPQLINDDSCFVVSERDLLQISSLNSPNDVLVLMKQKPIGRIDDIMDENVILALDSVKDPGNLGTIIRMADWFGVHHIICSSDTVDQYNPKTIQSAMGSISRVTLHYGALDLMLNDLTSFTIYGCDLHGKSLYKTNFDSKTILLFGSESHGISDKILKDVTHKITIPSFSSSRIDSLNVASASAIILSKYRN